MKLAILFCFVTFWRTDPVSFYTLPFNSLDREVNMQSFQGRKLLLVNIATGSPYSNQLGQLYRLKQEYKDSLMILVFPSNSFGHEIHSNAELRNYFSTTFDSSFILSEKIDVVGSNIHPIYNWLTDQGKNGNLNFPISSDFQKYLISESGELVGIFAPSVNPLSSELRTAINAH